MKKSMISLLLALCLLLTGVGFAEYTLPIGDGVNDSIKLMTQEGWYAPVSMGDNLETWQEIEKVTGIKIEWDVPADYSAVYPTRIASGNLDADIVRVGMGDVPVYSADGYAMALDDLIAEHAPNIQKVLEEDPDLKNLMTSPDGHIYFIAESAKDVNDLVMPTALFIRQDWLDALDLEVPTTLDEGYTVLTAFKNGDPNGNGIADEVPFSGIGLSGVVNWFASAYDLPAGVGQWWYGEDGVAYNVYASEAYINVLTEMAKWYAEGLLDPELNRNEADFQSFVSTNVVGAFKHLSERENQYNNLLSTSGHEGKYVLVTPPKGTLEDVPAAKRNPFFGAYIIPYNAKNAELAIKFIDFVWGTEQGVTLNEFGIEGKSYEVIDGKKVFTDFVMNNPDGLDQYNALRSMGSANNCLARTPAEVYEALHVNDNAVSYAASVNMVEPFPEQIIVTDDEQEVLSTYANDLNTYTSEALVKFLTGVTPMEEYQAFVDGMADYGLAQVLEVRQAQLDRFLGK